MAGQTISVISNSRAVESQGAGNSLGQLAGVVFSSFRAFLAVRSSYAWASGAPLQF